MSDKDDVLAALQRQIKEAEDSIQDWKEEIRRIRKRLNRWKKVMETLKELF